MVVPARPPHDDARKRHLATTAMAITSILFALVVVFILHRLLRSHGLKDIPGPTPSNWFLGYVYDLSPRPVGTLFKEWTRTYGQTYKVQRPLGVSVMRYLQCLETKAVFAYRYLNWLWETRKVPRMS